MSRPLLSALYVLADQLDAGDVDTVTAAEQLRVLAKFTPDESCTRMISFSRYLARLDDGIDRKWSVQTYHDAHGTTADLVTNYGTAHPSNHHSVIDFRRWEPAEVDAFGRAICYVAALLQQQLDNEADEAAEWAEDGAS